MKLPNFYTFSIKYKIVAVMLLVGGIVLTLASSAFLVNDVVRFRHTMVNNLMTLGELVALSNDAGLFFEIKDSTEENLAVLAANQHIVAAYLFSLDGNVFGSYHRSGANPDKYLPYETLSEFYYDTLRPQTTINKVEDSHFFRRGHLDVFKPVYFEGKIIGTVYLHSNLDAFWDYLIWAGGIVTAVLIAALILTVILASAFQRLLTNPLFSLLETMHAVSQSSNYALRSPKYYDDEFGSLCEGFNSMLAHIDARNQEIAHANAEISNLNEQLKAENLRMGAELDVAKQLQNMVLPQPSELYISQQLDVAGFMCSADEVGGDYYDVLRHPNGWIKFAVGDVTGHGLESGVIMLMVQTAVRTLLEYGVTDTKAFMSVLNRTIYYNIQRMNSDKMLTLLLLDYLEKEQKLYLTGQHEEIILIRHHGEVELLDTYKLGFFVGLQADIDEFIQQHEVHLDVGDCVILYTDGITEAMNDNKQFYGLNRLCDVAFQHRQKSANEIQQAIISDVTHHMGKKPAMDDITLVVIKQVA